MLFYTCKIEQCLPCCLLSKEIFVGTAILEPHDNTIELIYGPQCSINCSSYSLLSEIQMFEFSMAEDIRHKISHLENVSSIRTFLLFIIHQNNTISLLTLLLFHF